jgi:hypothetical protein
MARYRSNSGKDEFIKVAWSSGTDRSDFCVEAARGECEVDAGAGSIVWKALECVRREGVERCALFQRRTKGRGDELWSGGFAFGTVVPFDLGYSDFCCFPERDDRVRKEGTQDGEGGKVRDGAHCFCCLRARGTLSACLTVNKSTSLTSCRTIGCSSSFSNTVFKIGSARTSLIWPKQYASSWPSRAD